MRKRKNRINKWIAVMLAAVMLVGQCNVSVLAQEDILPVGQEASKEEKTDVENGDDLMQDSSEGNEGTDHRDAGQDGIGDTDSDSSDDDDNAGAGEGDAVVNMGGEESDDDGQDGVEEQDMCVCETACTEDAVNEECPVCMANYDMCVGNAGGESPEEMISEHMLNEEGDMPAENDEEPYAVVDEIWDEGSRLYYKITGDGEVEVNRQEPGETTKNLTIPGSVKKDGVTYRVTSIRGGAFKNNLYLTTVAIPASVSSIGDRAFEACPLTAVTLEEGVTHIGEYAFRGCGYLKGITIPGSVRSMGESAFENCSGLANLVIEEGVTSIGKSAFSLCESLTVVTIPNGVTSIGEAAFSPCKKLSSVTIPSSVTDIGAIAFAGCVSLTRVEIPDGVTKIEPATFEGCNKLVSVTIPKGVTSIGSNVFSGCENLTDVEIPQGVTKIEYATFYKCRKLANIELPQGVTSIGDYAFDTCTSLSHIEIPENVGNIGNGAFRNCSSLTSVEIPQSVTSIKESTFESCTSLSSVKISENVGSIGKGAFKDCSQLKTLNMVVSPDEEIRFPQVGQDAFAPFPDQDHKRYLYFYDTYDTGGNKLTGQAYEDVFAEAAKNDGDSDNSRWYGWSYEGFTAPIETHTVTVNVKKDGQPWSGHGRTFALLDSVDGSFIINGNPTADSAYSISQVPDGTYHIYDITDVPADILSLKSGDLRVNGMDTTVTVTVGGADVEKDVNYYTVTFYDGATAYGDNTLQKPQVILQGRQAQESEAPEKTGYRFIGWKTKNDGSVGFDFNKSINETTSVYASWETVQETNIYTITATAEEGGSISPSGVVNVNKGDTQAFNITADTGWQIRRVTVDGADVTAIVVGANGAYTFRGVTANHTIAAAFEEDGDEPSGGEDKPDDGEDKPSGGQDKPADGEKNEETSQKNDGGRTEYIRNVIAANADAPQTESGVTANPVSGRPEKQEEYTDTPNGEEPKTGDTAHMEIYATVAMIAGLTYLLLYFMEERRGMTEREKDVFVAAFIRWAKKGGRFRRCCAIVFIFCLLVYYHGIGKHAGKGIHRKNCLGQTL